jgi:hypothetical protein
MTRPRWCTEEIHFTRQQRARALGECEKRIGTRDRGVDDNQIGVREVFFAVTAQMELRDRTAPQFRQRFSEFLGRQNIGHCDARATCS